MSLTEAFRSLVEVCHEMDCECGNDGRDARCGDLRYALVREASETEGAGQHERACPHDGDCGCYEKKVERLRARVEEAERISDGLADAADRLERDREYNAGLVRERDARVAKLEGVLLHLRVMRHSNCTECREAAALLERDA